MFIPGRGSEGRVNIVSEYDLDTFEIVDSYGVTVWTGGTFTQLLEPDEVDANNGDTISNSWYASNSVAPKTATGVTRASPCVITVPSHGYSNGQYKFFRGFRYSGGGAFIDNFCPCLPCERLQKATFI